MAFPIDWRGGAFSKAAAGACVLALCLGGLAGCSTQEPVSQEPAAEEPSGDALSAEQAVFDDRVSATQTDEQIERLNMIYGYQSSAEEAEGLSGMDAFAYDEVSVFIEQMLAQYGDDAESGSRLHIVRGGFTPVDDAVTSYLLGVAFVVMEPGIEEEEDCPEHLAVVDMETGQMVDVYEDAQAALSGEYESPEDFAASGQMQAGIDGRSSEDVARAIWCTFKTAALDYEGINAALDKTIGYEE